MYRCCCRGRGGGEYSPGLVLPLALSGCVSETTVFIAFCYTTGTICEIQLRQVGGRHDRVIYEMLMS